MVDGYEQLKAGTVHVIWLSNDVGDFLLSYKKSKPKDVRKVFQILIKLADYGLDYMRDTTSFVREGSFATGKKNGDKAVVYAVKSFQLRIYGGFVTIEGKRCFLCVEAKQKKKDKADRAQLERVAKALGAYDV